MYASYCKSVDIGSIPVRASSIKSKIMILLVFNFKFANYVPHHVPLYLMHKKPRRSGDKRQMLLRGKEPCPDLAVQDICLFTHQLATTSVIAANDSGLRIATSTSVTARTRTKFCSALV
jgi:hypothetical protein